MNWLGSLPNWITAVTAAISLPILVIYARATIRQAEQARLQNEAAFRPVIAADLEAGGDLLTFTNVGNGPAINARWLGLRDVKTFELMQSSVVAAGRKIHVGRLAHWGYEDCFKVDYESISGTRYRTIATLGTSESPFGYTLSLEIRELEKDAPGIQLPIFK